MKYEQSFYLLLGVSVNNSGFVFFFNITYMLNFILVFYSTLCVLSFKPNNF